MWKNTIISVTGLIVVFVIAYELDRWDRLIERQARANFDLSLYLWFLSIATLIIAISVLLLAWFVWFRENQRWLIAVIFLLIGLFGTFSFTVTRGVPFFAIPNSRVAYVSAFVTVVGAARLFLRKQ